MKSEGKPTVMLELRPAFDGYAGIPQETRLLFRGLRMLGSFDVAGMLQMSHRILARGTAESGFFSDEDIPEARKINRYSRVVISAAEKPFSTVGDRIRNYFERRLMSADLTIGTLLGFKKIKLSLLRTQYFEDFIWRSLFAKTLPAADFHLVTTARQLICRSPWHTMHMVGLNTLNIRSTPVYPRLDTRGVDIFVSQTPYPARIRPQTAFVVRYHDALPVLMPHTISDKSLHQATHFYALMSNIRSGAYFACVSDSTRKDLLSIFPEAESKAVTIHNMVSHHYYLEESSPRRVPGIIRSRLYGFDADARDLNLSPKFLTLREQEKFYENSLNVDPLKYLLVVSTIEPRKNHARLIAAWELLKAERDVNLKLVIVGTLGWDYKQLIKGFRTWIDRGELFMLNAVPSSDLRVLYKHAVATVCPSLGEGFDFSGVESMRSGGIVIASDIPVHREIYAQAAEYFDPYSTGSLVNAIKAVVYSSDSQLLQARLRAFGQKISEQYLPESILPKWSEFLSSVHKDAHLTRRSNDRSRFIYPSPAPLPQGLFEQIAAESMEDQGSDAASTYANSRSQLRS